MKAQIKFFLAILMAVVTSTAMISCSETAQTQYMPMGGGGSAVSGSAVMINAATEALNDTSVKYAYNKAGYGMAIWYSTTGYGERFLYAIYNPSRNTWSQAEEFYRNISTPSVSSNGTDFMVIFAYSSGVYARPWTNGAFGEPVKITTFTSDCNLTAIASDGTGYCATWRQYDPVNDRQDVYAARYTGAAWGAPAALDTTAQTPDSIRIVSGGSGYCVSWYENSTDRTFASVYNGSWSAAQNIGNAWPTNTYQIAGNTAGVFLVLFDDSSNGTNSIFAREFNGSWGGVTEPDTGVGTGPAYSPHIASNGTAFCAVWYQYDGLYYSIYARRYDAGWDITQGLESATYNAYDPVIASDGSGYCVTWCQYDGTSNKTYASYFVFVPTVTWSGAQVLNPASTANADRQRISSDGTGYIVNWTEDDSAAAPESRYTLHASILNGTTWSGPTLMSTYKNQFQDYLALPVTGGYALTYCYYTDTIPALMTTMYRNGGWSDALDIVAGQRRGSCIRPADVPLLYRAGTETVLVWRQHQNIGGTSMQQIFANVKNGSTWGTPLLISSDSNQPHFAASNGSSVCVVWYEYNSAKSRYIVLAKIYSNGAWGATAIVDNDTDGYYAYQPMVAGNASANDFCVIWYQYDGVAYYRLHANLHTASGWAGPVQIDNAGISDSASPYYIVAGTTGYCVAFYQNSLTYGTVFTGSGWTTPTQLHSSSFYVYKPSMAGSGDHYAVVYNNSGNVYANVYDGSSWSGMDIQDNISTSGAYDPTIAGDGDGGFCMAWREDTAGYYSITARVYDGSSLTWGDAENAEVPDIFDANYYSSGPRVASNGTGYAVTYRKQDIYNSYSLYTSVYDSGTWLGAELLENNIAHIEDYYFDIASNGTGYGVVWWQYDAAMNMMAYGSVYDGGVWDSRPLSNGEGAASSVEVLGTGSSYTSAWFQVDATDKLVQNIWANTFK